MRLPWRIPLVPLTVQYLCSTLWHRCRIAHVVPASASRRGIGNTKPLFTRVFSTDRVRTPVPPCRLVPAPGVGPHAQRRTHGERIARGCRACPRLPALPGATPRPCQRLALRACLVLGDGQRGLKRGGCFEFVYTPQRSATNRGFMHRCPYCPTIDQAPSWARG